MRNVVIILLFLPFCTYCQEPQLKYKKWLIGVSYEANISGRQLNYSASNEWVEQMRNDSEIPNYGFSTGVNFRYNLTPDFSIETGLLFANRGFATKKESLYWATPNSDFPFDSKTTFSFYYIEIPLKANYNFNIGKIKLYATSGISMNNFTNRNTTITTYNNSGDRQKTKSQQNYGYQQDSYSILLGFGIDLPISNRLLLNIEPIYRQNLTSIVSDKNAKEYLYSVGLNTKLFLKMKKKTR